MGRKITCPECKKTFDTDKIEPQEFTMYNARYVCSRCLSKLKQTEPPAPQDQAPRYSHKGGTRIG